MGIAYLNTMCGSASVGVVQDRHGLSSTTGSTLAHEIGHLLNMEHDTGESQSPIDHIIHTLSYSHETQEATAVTLYHNIFLQ